MANLNKVFLMGNLTRDPQVSYLPNQMAICEIGIATNRRWTDKEGQQKEDVTFVDCTSFGKTAETIGKYLRKGRPIFIEGRLKLDTWEDKNGGGKRSKMRVVIENFQFIDSGNRAQSVEGQEGEAGNAMAGAVGAGGNGGGAGGFAPRTQQRPAMRTQGRPAPQGGAGTNGNAEMDQPGPEDDAPPISESDIPF